MTAEERQIDNTATILIDKDWTKCIDFYGVSRTKEYAKSYREKAKVLIGESVSFADWCFDNANNDPTYKGPVTKHLPSEIRKMFPRGSSVRILEEGPGTPPVGELCKVVYVDKLGMVHVKWNEEGYALVVGGDKFMKVQIRNSSRQAE